MQHESLSSKLSYLHVLISLCVVHSQIHTNCSWCNLKYLRKLGILKSEQNMFFNYLDEEYLHMHAQVTTAVILAFFSPSCFFGYYVNSELKQNSLFGPFQYSYLCNLSV